MKTLFDDRFPHRDSFNVDDKDALQRSPVLTGDSDFIFTCAAINILKHKI